MASNALDYAIPPNRDLVLGYDNIAYEAILNNTAITPETFAFLTKRLAELESNTSRNQLEEDEYTLLIQEQPKWQVFDYITPDISANQGSYPLDLPGGSDNVTAPITLADLGTGDFTFNDLSEYYKNLNSTDRIRIAEALFMDEFTTFDPEDGESIATIYDRKTVLTGLYQAAMEASRKAAVAGDMTFVPTLEEGALFDPKTNAFSRDEFYEAINEVTVQAQQSSSYTDPFEVDRQFDAYSKQYIGRAPTAAEARSFKSQYRFLEETGSGFAPVIGGQAQNFLEESNPEEVLAQQSSNVSSIISKLSRSNLGQ